MQNWIEEVSSFLKEQDPNHLVTVGEEGFYGKLSCPLAHHALHSFDVDKVVTEHATLRCLMLPCWCDQHLDSLHALSI